MEQQPGFHQSSINSSIVCKLHKAIYRQKQAPWAWFERLHDFLTSTKFFSSKDDSLLLSFTKSSTKFILVYVDDILIIGSSITEIQKLVTQLNAVFLLEALGELNYFLGIEVLQNSTTFHFSQTNMS